MRDKFSELIKAGVASFCERPVGSPAPTLDPMVKAYNNLWGLLTDTHMSKLCDECYIITGTFVKSQYWERFKYCSYWGSTNIRLGSGYNSLECMVYSNGYQMAPDTYNGDYVIKLTKRPEDSRPEDSAEPGVECCGCAVPCCQNCDPCVISLGESEIPHPFKEFFTREESDAIIEAWKGGDGNAMKVLENLKDSTVIDGSRFRISADNQYMIVDEKLKIDLHASKK